MKKEKTQLKTKQLKPNFFKSVEVMGFRQLQRKKARGKFCEEKETPNHRYITYELNTNPSAPTRVGFLYEAGLCIAFIRSRVHLYGVGHSE